MKVKFRLVRTDSNNRLEYLMRASVPAKFAPTSEVKKAEWWASSPPALRNLAAYAKETGDLSFNVDPAPEAVAPAAPATEALTTIGEAASSPEGTVPPLAPPATAPTTAAKAKANRRAGKPQRERAGAR